MQRLHLVGLVHQNSGRRNYFELKTKFFFLLVRNVGPEVEDLLNVLHWQTGVAGSYTGSQRGLCADVAHGERSHGLIERIEF